MAYCKNCGSQIDDNSGFCPKCGASQQQASYPAAGPSAPAVVDNGGIGWGLLGCCIPIVGLILFLIWKDTKPRTAKAAGIGALISVCISIVWYILIAVIGAGAGLY